MGASVINVYIRVVMRANRLRVNHCDFIALHSMWSASGITTLIYTLITLAPISYLRSLVVRAVHRHRTGVGSIPAGGPYS